MLRYAGYSLGVGAMFLLACAENFAAWGAKYFVTAYVFPSQERMNRILARLRDAGQTVVPVGLFADDETLIQRHQNRPEDYGTDPECLRDALACNAGVQQLRGVYLVDTTHLCQNAVADVILEHCRSIEPTGRADAEDRAPQPEGRWAR